MSGARPVTDPPPPGTVTYAPATAIRGPVTVPSRIASRRATSTNARKVPTSRTVVNPASTVARALPTPLRASWAALRSTAGIPDPWSSPTRWVWQSISPGSRVCPARSRTSAPSGGGWPGSSSRLDPLAPDQQPPSLEDLPGLDVDQPRSPDRQQPAVPVAHALASSVPALLTPMMTDGDFPLDRTIRRIRSRGQSHATTNPPPPGRTPTALAPHAGRLRADLRRAGRPGRVGRAGPQGAPGPLGRPAAPGRDRPARRPLPTRRRWPPPAPAPGRRPPAPPCPRSRLPAVSPIALAAQAPTTEAASRATIPATTPRPSGPPATPAPPAPSLAPTTTEPRRPRSARSPRRTTVEPTTTTAAPTTTTVEATTTTTRRARPDHHRRGRPRPPSCR